MIYFKYSALCAAVLISVVGYATAGRLRSLNPLDDMPRVQKSSVIDQAASLRNRVYEGLLGLKSMARGTLTPGARRNLLDASSGSKFVQFSTFDSLDCSDALAAVTTYGANICMETKSSIGTRSMMYAYGDLTLSQHLFLDDSCQILNTTKLIRVVEALDVCVDGVMVSVSDSFLTQDGQGEIVSEYVNLEDCMNSHPLQSAWVSVEHQGNATNMDLENNMQQLVTLAVSGNQTCLAANMVSALDIGTDLPEWVAVYTDAFVSIEFLV
jgi:hypothetical protein